jgi:phosphate-selective porin OprO/OprP
MCNQCVRKGLIFMITWFLSVSPVHANNDALLTLLQALHENGTINTETYELVKQVAQQEQTQPQVVAATDREELKQVVKEEVAEATKDQPKVTSKGKFQVESKDGDFSFRVGGRIHANAALHNEDRLHHNDGTEMRRARLFAEGRLWRDWGYKLEYDFVNTGNAGITDAILDYNGIQNLKIRTGHFKEPFSLQNMTSSKYITFMERALPFVFVPGRNIGVSANTSGSNWSFSAGVFGQGIDGAAGDNDEGYGGSARGTYAPMIGENTRLHLGLSGSYRATGSLDNVRFRDRPESHVTDQRLFDTGNIDTDDFSRFAVELALISGPLTLEGEYYHLSLNRDLAGNPDLDFSGYYLQGSWFLTGEMKSYNVKSGAFGKTTPKGIVGKGGIGAWQIALRFSSIDMNDGDINGGEETNLTAGLNWFVTPDIRLSANYVSVLEVDGGPAAGDEPDIFQIMTLVEF